MNRETFERQYRDDWRRMEDALEQLENKRYTSVEDFPELYRRVCHHLALARSRLYGTDLAERLNRLVMRGHHQLYRKRHLEPSEALDYLVAGFPREVRRHSRLFWISFALFFGPLLGTLVAVLVRPDLIYSVMDPLTVESFQSMYDPAVPSHRAADTDVMMFGYYIQNNISIAFQTFAGGIVFALGSIFYLIYNGLTIGAVAGHITNVGHGGSFYPFVVGHGSFELMAVVLAGMAGLRLGLAVLAPGRQTRGAALMRAGRESVRLIYGVAVLLVVAAFIEAFWSSATWLPAAVKIGVGGLGWLAMAAYLALGGRGREA